MTVEEVIDKLNPIQFKYNSDDKITFGFKAQDIEAIFPQDKYSIIKTDEKGFLMVDYAQIASLLFIYCKNLNEEVQKLKEQINAK